jgi:Zn-dependent M28 family amino/carboxypeptidase
VTASVGLANKVSRVETANVIGRLPGTDRSGEAVLITSHHDHLGVRPGVAPGDDAIYNGAVDNATGISSLIAMARAFAALPERPRRSIYFAAVGAEEQGTIGSQWLSRSPPVPLAKLAASINIDAMNVFGRTKDIIVVGLGKSTLDATVLGVARWQGREVKGDPHPDRGGYYRSDHFPLAKVGVPATYIAGGSEFVGHPAGWGEQTVEGWQRQNYHQPSDEWRDAFDLSGMLEDTRLVFFVAAQLARAPEMPRWNAGDEFEATRKRTLQTLGAP